MNFLDRLSRADLSSSITELRDYILNNYTVQQDNGDNIVIIENVNGYEATFDIAVIDSALSIIPEVVEDNELNAQIQQYANYLFRVIICRSKMIE